jgi:hypothetical protein
MAWAEITRRQYRRDDLRYASNLTDDEWSLIKPFLPGPARLGRYDVTIETLRIGYNVASQRSFLHLVEDKSLPRRANGKTVGPAAKCVEIRGWRNLRVNSTTRVGVRAPMEIIPPAAFHRLRR